MPKVTGQNRFFIPLIYLALACNLQIAAQVNHADSSKKSAAEDLYEQLRSVGLDSSRVYQIREASLDRSSLHISLSDGTIAFTQDVAGRITGAFFDGDGEVLLIPPNSTERGSMALFTGAAILEEGFDSAYLRFNDDTFKELEPFLRPSSENSQAFVTRWNDAARVLAQDDALRLFTSFSRFLPVNESVGSQASKDSIDPNDRMLHLKVEGRKLGAFDLFFDLTAREQISAGQLKKVDDKTTYDVWTSFAFKNQKHTGDQQHSDVTADIAGAENDKGDVEVSNYKISAEIKPPTELNADARMQMLVRHGGGRTVLFELSRYLKIREVKADGRRLEFIHNPALEGTQLDRRGDDLVAVVFPEPLRSGQKIGLQFSYGGEVLSDAGGGLLYVGARGTWYPNRGFSKATFDLEFRYPAGWTLIATGERKDEAATTNPLPHNGLPAEHTAQVSRWISERPIPVAGFNLGKYRRVTKRAGKVTVEVYAASEMERSFPPPAADIMPPPEITQRRPLLPRLISPPPPPSPAGNAAAVAEDAARAISFFASQFGPYPYNDLLVTQMPGSVSQGWPGLIFLSSFSFLSADEKTVLHMSSVEQTMVTGVIAHETAHQWWGDLVTWSGYRDQWIMEALASYSTLLLLESQNPSEFRKVMDKYRNDLLKENDRGQRFMDAGPVTLGARLTSSKFPDGYETIAYERGAWLFHMLRTMMRDAEQKNGMRRAALADSSDEPFLQALRALREQYQAKPVTTADLIRIFAEHLPPSAWHDGKPSLDWFYEGWVNGTAIPQIELRGLKFRDLNNSTVITGVIQQKEAPESLITSVPLYAAVHGRNVLLGRVFADGQETQFHLTSPLGTRKVLLDPEHTVLSRSH